MFQPIVLKWDGVAYTVPANRVLAAIATVENVLTLDELGRFTNKGTVPLARVAQAYGALMRFAGADVTDDAIYAGMFDSTDVNPVMACQALLAMMLPPAHIVRKAVDAGDVGKSQAGGKNSSAISIKSSSGKNGSRRPNSGI